jgi:hypothetical protein
VQPTPASDPADSVTLTVRLPQAVYDTIAAIWGTEREIAEQVAALITQAAAFGSPADLAQDLGATTRELAALRAELETVARILAEAELRPVGAPHPL